MRLLYIVHQFLPRYVTGTEQYVRSLALGMLDRGHAVSILALEPMPDLDSPGCTWIERDEEIDGIPVRRVGVSQCAERNEELAEHDNPLAVRLLRRYLDEQEFDLAHVFHLRFLGGGALDELRVVGLPVVVNLMDFWFLCPRFTLLRGDGALCDGPPDDGIGCIPCLDPALGEVVDATGLAAPLRALGVAADPRPGLAVTPMRRARALVGRKDRLFAALETAAAVVAPSRFLRSVFENNGFRSGVVRHVPYGVDPDRLGGMRKEWSGTPGSPLAIGYIGSFTEHKGLHVLIEALRAIDGDGWRLFVHGDPTTLPAYTKRVRALADDDERIEFCGPFEPCDLGRVLATLDLLVVPSLWYENTPFSVLEAQMMELPVVASDLGGITESIEDGRNGFVFPAGNVDALASVLRDVLADPARLPGMELRGRVRTLDENLDDFEALYAELAAGSPQDLDAEPCTP